MWNPRLNNPTSCECPSRFEYGPFFFVSEGQLSSQELFESLLRRQKAAADVGTPGPVSESSDADVSEEARERVREKMQKVG